MEENLNLDAAEEIAEEQADDPAEDSPAEDGAKQAAPTREEILAASRKENKNGDERETGIYLRGMQLAYGVGIVLLGIFNIYNTLYEEFNPELWIVMMAMSASWSLYYGIKSSRRRALFLTCAVICLIATVFHAVYWILQLCGVIK